MPGAVLPGALAIVLKSRMSITKARSRELRLVEDSLLF